MIINDNQWQTMIMTQVIQVVTSDTSETSNIDYSSDASKTSASVTRISSYKCQFN